MTFFQKLTPDTCLFLIFASKTPPEMTWGNGFKKCHIPKVYISVRDFTKLFKAHGKSR